MTSAWGGVAGPLVIISAGPALKQPKAHIVPLETFSGNFVVEIPMTDSMTSAALILAAKAKHRQAVVATDCRLHHMV